MANFRSQGLALSGYANDNDGEMPARQTYNYYTVSGQLISEILAHYEHEDFPPDPGSTFQVRTGNRRYPELANDRERADWRNAGRVWMDRTRGYHPRGDASQTQELYPRDVQEFM